MNQKKGGEVHHTIFYTDHFSLDISGFPEGFIYIRLASSGSMWLRSRSMKYVTPVDTPPPKHCLGRALRVLSEHVQVILPGLRVCVR